MLPKKFFKTSFILLTFGIFFSCSSDDDSGTTPIGEETQLVLTASATETTPGEEITFEVTADGETVSDAEILIDGTGISGYSHVFEAVGNYQVVAQKEGYRDSEAVEIQVKEENIRLKTYKYNSVEYAFSYNSDNFLSSVNYGEGNVGNVIYDVEKRVTQIGGVEYTYNGSGLITTMTVLDNSSTINRQADFIYNNENLVAESHVQYTSVPTGETTYFTREFEYNTNGRLVSMTEFGLPGQFDYRLLFIYDANGNILQIKWQESLNGSPFTDYKTHTYTYDDKKNPRYALLNCVGMTDRTTLIDVEEVGASPLMGNYTNFRMNYYNPNNVLSFSYHYNISGDSGGSTYEYVYNEDGYPTSAEESKTFADGHTDMYYYRWEYETYTGE